MKPVNETTLLLVVILAGSTLSTSAWGWHGWIAPVVTYGGALFAGMACARITRIVRRATT
jgi:ATP/ADP translocase